MWSLSVSRSNTAAFSANDELRLANKCGSNNGNHENSIDSSDTGYGSVATGVAVEKAAGSSSTTTEFSTATTTSSSSTKRHKPKEETKSGGQLLLRDQVGYDHSSLDGFEESCCSSDLERLKSSHMSSSSSSYSTIKGSSATTKSRKSESIEQPTAIKRIDLFDSGDDSTVSLSSSSTSDERLSEENQIGLLRINQKMARHNSIGLKSPSRYI